MPDDLSLLAEAAAHGDDRALDELVRRTLPRVRRLCAHLGSRSDAEDLAQETYLRALRTIHRFRGDSSVEVWLFSIARHVCADHVRRRVRRGEIDRRFPARRRVALPDESVTTTDLLARLDPDQAAAFHLTQTFGLSYAEAAAVCGCPIGTIRSRVARARVELVRMVQDADAG